MQITDFIVCDDIRHEIGGKSSLIGVYGNGLKITVAEDYQGPLTFQCKIFLHVVAEEEEKAPDKIVIRALINDKEVFRSEGKSSGGRSIKMLAVPFQADIPIENPGVLALEATFFSDGEKVCEKLLPQNMLITIEKKKTE